MLALSRYARLLNGQLRTRHAHACSQVYYAAGEENTEVQLSNQPPLLLLGPVFDGIDLLDLVFASLC